MQQKILYAGITGRSYAEASATLDRLSNLIVDAKQIERIIKSIGGDRVSERDAATTAFQELPLVKKFVAAPDMKPPDLAVVMVDGGRLQILDRPAAETADSPVAPEVAAAEAVPPEATAAAAAAQEPAAATAVLPEPDWEEEEPPRKGHWREDKVGLLLSMKSEAHAADPCPDIPASFLDVVGLPKLARQLKKNARAGEDAVVDTDDPEAADEALAAEAVYEPPQVLTRQVVASRCRWPLFAPLVAAAAWALSLQGAARKAFVGDGSANNWTLQRRFFSSFVPILDFIHALSYVFAAAMAGRKFAAGWACYQQWITWVWQGKVSEVIAALRARQSELGVPSADEPETSAAQLVSKALAYLEHHQDKMKYDEYRKAGLPITSSLMESAVKQINRRVKGSEKFWSEEGSEAVLQLRADQLSDDEILETFWERRQAEATGQRRYRRRSA